MSKRIDIFKITFGSCKLMQPAFLCKGICDHGFDRSTNLILLKIDIHLRYAMMHVFFSKLLLVVANLCNLRLFANKFVCTVLTDDRCY